jgi:hypothetical protein
VFKLKHTFSSFSQKFDKSKGSTNQCRKIS